MAATKKTNTRKTGTAGRTSVKTKSKSSASAAKGRETKAEREERQAQIYKKKRIHDEVWAIIIVALGIFFVLSLQTDSTGAIGAAVKNLLFGCFGRVAFGIAYFLILFGILVFAEKTAFLSGRSLCFIFLLFVFSSCINSVFVEPLKDASYVFQFSKMKEVFLLGKSGGGIFGVMLGSALIKMSGKTGLFLISIVGIIICLLFVLNSPISAFFDKWKIRRTAAKKEREEAEAYAAKNTPSSSDLGISKTSAASVSREAFNAEIVDPQISMNKSQLKPVPLNEAVKTEAAPKTGLFGFGRKKAEEPDAKDEIKTIVREEPAAEDKIEDSAKASSGSFFDKPLDMQAIKEFTPEDIGLKSEVQAVHVIEGDFTDNQKKILGYMSDDNLFGSSKKTAGYGLNGEGGANASSPEINITVKDEDGKTENVVIPPIKAEEEKPKEPKGYRFPPLNLLRKVSASKDGNTSDLNAQARLLEDTLQSFGVSASVIDVVKGPAVTRFEVQPASGVKVANIVKLKDDIALNLRAKSLRIEAPIPGKPAVGIEVSNDSVNMVSLREILESKEFKNHKSKIAVALGKSVGGDAIVCDIKEMPHLIIAGTTGSGKSVCINGIILSLLYKATPDEVKLIMVDPKFVELSNYNGIPHLLIPVVTDPGKASAALAWAVSEMNNRYSKFQEEEVRDIESYNETVRANGEDDKVLPQIVIIIDELADLMMAAQNSVEDSICRLAQKARAAGMHLIIATQRPSVNVITGVIKANVPSKIAFAVSSQIDSRVILDCSGAEELLGKGDMLYYPMGMSKPMRVQGSFVNDQEVNDVIEFIKKNSGDSEYEPEVVSILNNVQTSAAAGTEGSDEDEYLTDAIECVVRAEQASVSMLQRRFRIGYNRAARLIDIMEERGIVGPADGSKPRKVLMTIAQFEALSMGISDSESNEDPNPGVEEEIY